MVARGKARDADATAAPRCDGGRWCRGINLHFIQQPSLPLHLPPPPPPHRQDTFPSTARPGLRTRSRVCSRLWLYASWTAFPSTTHHPTSTAEFRTDCQAKMPACLTAPPCPTPIPNATLLARLGWRTQGFPSCLGSATQPCALSSADTSADLCPTRNRRTLDEALLTRTVNTRHPKSHSTHSAVLPAAAAPVF